MTGFQSTEVVNNSKEYNFKNIRPRLRIYIYQTPGGCFPILKKIFAGYSVVVRGEHT
ncbi:hypothetical protein SAMN05444280_1271 [Tangfeifania diversioriginum]|uniref:Uncharacterized protein n=1 Tax=Tangfeifania diversioriginum TaxID=1168035 RepID=A0A1M6LIB4_9BACT|nr:hypothetical protein SAMN05444280_1271 [Tangfeifania diversioriginum]